MPTVNISPVWNGTQFLTETGKPLVGGKIYTYEGGSFSTEKTTYSSNTGTAENPNPIVLDTTGRMPTDIWLVPGELYNLVLTKPDGEIIKNVDNVSVGQIIAGDNISIDPANGIGAVTITGIWPKTITNNVTRGRSYLYWLTGTEGMLFDGNAFSVWAATLKSPTNVTSPDVQWLSNAGEFKFNNAGTYTISITGRITPSAYETNNWPVDTTAFGSIVTGGSNNFKTYHTRYSQFSGDNLPSDEQQTTWTDILTISAAANANINLSTYALSPNYTTNGGLVELSVIITRIGDAYVIGN